MINLQNYLNNLYLYLNLKKYSAFYYYSFIFFITIYYSLRTSVLQNYPISIFLLVAAIMFFLKIITTDFLRRDMLFVFIFLFLGTINTILSGSTITLIVLCVIVGAKDININTALKVILYTKIIIASLLSVLSFFSIIENVSMIHNRSGNNVGRNSLGYEHPNVFGKILFQCILLYFVIYKEKFKKIDWIVVLFLNYFVFSITKNRTSFILVCFLVICVLLIRKCNDHIKYSVCKLIKFAPLILLFFSYVIPKYFYSMLSTNAIFNTIDSILQYRITFSHLFLLKFNIHFFGQPVYNYWSDGYAFLDSGYLNLLLGTGVLLTLLYIIGYYKLVNVFIKNKEYYLILAVLCISIYGLTENIIYSFFYNFTFIYFSYLLYKPMEAKSKLNILVINTVNMGFNGISNVIMSHYRYQKQKCWNFHFVCNYYIESTYGQEILKQGDSYDVLDKRKSLIKYVYNLLRLVIKGDYDIIHIHGNSTFMLLESVISNFGSAKIIVHCHNTHVTSEFIEKYFNGVFKKTYDLALACSKQSGDWLFGENKYVILKNGIDGERYFFNERNREDIRNRLGIEDKKVILQVGIFNEQKNHKFFLEVLQEILKTSKDYCYLVVGDGPLHEDIANLIEKYNVKENVILLGESSDVSSFYSASDLFVLPSLFEGLGIVLVEAQASGIPCLISKGVPKEAMYASNVEYIDLDVSKWSKKIINHDMKRNINAKSDFKNSSYDLIDSAEHLVDIYMRLCNKEVN